MDIRILGEGDDDVLVNVAAGVFDHPVDPQLAREFLSDSRHHLAVALDDGVVVGMASAVHYVHPDKPAELWVNEVGIAPAYRGQGIGKTLLSELFRVGRRLCCREACVLTDRSNVPAMRLYFALRGAESSADTVMFTFRLECESLEPVDGPSGQEP